MDFGFRNIEYNTLERFQTPKSTFRNPKSKIQNPKSFYVLTCAIAIFATVIPTTLIAEGIKRVGSSNGAIVGFVGPVSMIFMANLFLGEKITILQLLGTAVVLMGVLRVAKK